MPPPIGRAAGLADGPAMLTNGNGISSRAPSRSSPASITERPTISHSLWLRGTPFGCASVPEVQQTVSTSCAVSPIAPACARSASASSGTAASSSGRSGSTPSGQPDADGSPSEDTGGVPGCAAASAAHIRACSKRPTFSVVTTRRAPVRDSTCSSSCARYCTGTGDTTMPVAAQAR